MQLRPLTPVFGAEVSGVDLRQPLDATTCSEFNQAFLEHKVLVLRDQAITTAQTVAFSRCFGELQEAPRKMVNEDLNRNIDRYASRFIHEGALPDSPDNNWHADSTNHAEPELGGVIRSIRLPPVGGDTLFADMHAAFVGLTPAMQETVRSMRAVHDIAVMSRRNRLSVQQLNELHEIYPPVEHPVIRTHPVTGQEAVFVNTVWTSHIVGLSRNDSDELLALLFRQATKPEYQFRLTWTDHTVAVWDNRVVQHYATADYGKNLREMERVSIKGDRPR